MNQFIDGTAMASLVFSVLLFGQGFYLSGVLLLALLISINFAFSDLSYLKNHFLK